MNAPDSLRAATLLTSMGATASKDPLPSIRYTSPPSIICWGTSGSNSISALSPLDDRASPMVLMRSTSS